MESFKELGTKGAIAILYEGSGYKACSVPMSDCRPGRLVTSCVTMSEGIDFDLSYFPLQHLGYKAVVKVSGELMSRFAKPLTLSVCIGVSSKLDFPEVSQIWKGIVAAAHNYSYESVALKLQPSLTGLSISLAGSAYDDLSLSSRRAPASSMDLICVTSNPGASFLGDQILRTSAPMDEKKRSDRLERYKQLVHACLKPELPANLLDSLADSEIVPSFMYYCTDSLRSVLHSLSEESGLGLKIYVDKLPFASGSIDASKELGVDPVQAALKGGDDNIMLLTIPISQFDVFRHDFQDWDVIGHLARPETGAVLVTPDSLEHEL